MRNLLLILFALAAMIAGALAFERPYAAQDDDAEVESDEEESEEERNARLATNAYFILRNNCWGCHGEPGKEHYGETTPLDWILDYDKLVKHKVVVPGEAGKSRLIRIILTDDMPRAFDEQGKPSKRADLAEGELETLIDWIKAGAPEWRDVEQEFEWVRLTANGPASGNPVGSMLTTGPDGRPSLLLWNDDALSVEPWSWDGTEWMEVERVDWKAGTSVIGAHDPESGRTFHLYTGTELSRWWLAEWTSKGFTSVEGFKIDLVHTENYGFAYDPASDRLLLYGGYSPEPPSEYEGPGTSRGKADPSSDLWIWRDKQLVKLAAEPAPPAAAVTAFGYVPKMESCVLLTSGESGPETWILKGDEWTKRDTSQTPPLTKQFDTHWLLPAWDPVNEWLVVHGPDDDAEQTWAWDGEDWRMLSQNTITPTRKQATIAWDPASKRMILYGGYNGEWEWLNETWALVPWRRAEGDGVDETD